MTQANPRTEQLVMRLLDTAGALERQIDTALSFTRGITFSEYRLLQALARAGDPGLTRVALAGATAVTPSAVTRALKPLEKLGYVTTVKNERDARQSLARLTEGGRELLSDASGVLTDVLNELAADRVDEQQADTFLQVLASLKKR